MPSKYQRGWAPLLSAVYCVSDTSAVKDQRACAASTCTSSRELLTLRSGRGVVALPLARWCSKTFAPLNSPRHTSGWMDAQ